MEVEKRGVKGGFFQLFDWNGKSRKKLFSGRSDFPESSNQGKDYYRNSVIGQHHQGLEKGFQGQNDYHYTSSENGDSEYVTKAPGVVARLMGLDSLPTSKAKEHSFTPFIEPHSFRDTSHLISAPPFQNEHDIVIFESVRNKLDGYSRNPLDLRVQKMQSRHLERFQSEMLPPKSAKPVPVPHNRLLSPIKSPGFVPPKNAAYIIEAAAKIIEQSPRSTTKVNYPSLGSSSSSIPFRVRDMKEKMEASQRASRSADVGSQKSKDQKPVNTSKKYLNNTNKGKIRSEDNYSYNGPQRLKSKEKPASLAVQAKTNVQKQDGLKQKGLNGMRNTEKKLENNISSTRRQSEVLKVNNQKQNRAFTEDEENSGPSCSHTKERKESNLPTNYVNGRTNRNVHKIVVNNNVVTSRKTNFVAADSGKEISSSRAKSKKKMQFNGNNNTQSANTVTVRDEKSVKCNIEFEFDSKWDEFDKKKNSLDVVSFTFTSPIKKSGAGSSSFPYESDFRNSTASSTGFDVIGGDALSVLLEQKLKELTSKVEMSQTDLSEGGSVSYPGNGYGNVNSSIELVKSMHVANDTCKSKREIQYDSDSSYIAEHGIKTEKEKKELAYIERNGYNIDINLQGPISFSNQPSLSVASFDSIDDYRSSSNEGLLPGLSLGSYEGMNINSTTKSHIAESDVEISDTASSLSVGFASETVNSSSYALDSKYSSSNWELQYIVDILTSGELLLEEFALGQSHKVIAPDLFDQLETQKMDSYKDMGEENVLERKVLFDSVCECLELRCGKLLVGSSELWVKQMTMLKRWRVLADELYREIMSWTNVEEMMVDELVEKDMSCKNGKWTDFDVEAFEEGVEIEERILTCLVDELIDDFLF
ncbi:hypothetical protein CASFOL_035556 [Castilleja foliolosa]|uniref:DUF4378 domain-containing protein n=1 Tax=Castilleja foliolosa TaxID=1961234 RepID=A0ABD3BTX1_9LAMI